MDVQAQIALQSYSALRPATQPDDTANSPFSSFMNGFNSFTQTLKHSDTVAAQSTKGNVDPHVLVEALAQSELAVETAVKVRNKVVEAYQEILRMPV
ncbi:flagellar hook-basal body complex protein FliE [Rhodobacteraceae bacterium]|nr:flagellar hook-basal body complex protein FliE [Paracoccaceae bacterium]